MNLEKATVTIPYTEFQEHKDELESAQKSLQEYRNNYQELVVATSDILSVAMKSPSTSLEISKAVAELGYEVKTDALWGSRDKMLTYLKKTNP